MGQPSHTHTRDASEEVYVPPPCRNTTQFLLPVALFSK